MRKLIHTDSQMLRYGCTRLEIGVQSVYEDVARDTNRGHTVRAVSESFHLAKDAGFKVVAHMMPDLPNVGVERDLEQFKEYFENPAFRSDGLKIYPTLVIRGTGLYELWRTGRYKNYTPNVLVDVVARILALVPPWTRVYRVQRWVAEVSPHGMVIDSTGSGCDRDIPLPLVTSGCENSGNLRELALNRMKDFGAECRDVRFREVGVRTTPSPSPRASSSDPHATRCCHSFLRPLLAESPVHRAPDCGHHALSGRPHRCPCFERKTVHRHAALRAGVRVRVCLRGLVHHQPLRFCLQIHEIHHKVRPESVELLRRDYAANGGWETFLSYEDPERDILIGLLRLRKCSDEGTFRPELVRRPEGGCSIVRELHVYGTAVPVHGRDPTKFQHQVSGCLGSEGEGRRPQRPSICPHRRAAVRPSGASTLAVARQCGLGAFR